jgi:hypothetical protein
MNKDNYEKRSCEHWLYLLFCLLPFVMVGMYYMGWYVLFRICSIPIIIFIVVSVYGKAKNGYWISALLLIFFFLLYSVLGFLLTNNIMDGICMGCYFSVISGIIEKAFRNFNKRRM